MKVVGALLRWDVEMSGKFPIGTRVGKINQSRGVSLGVIMEDHTHHPTKSLVKMDFGQVVSCMDSELLLEKEAMDKCNALQKEFDDLSAAISVKISQAVVFIREAQVMAKAGGYVIEDLGILVENELGWQTSSMDC